MRRYITILAGLTASLLSLPVPADSLPDRMAISEKTQAFMSAARSGDITGAYERLKPVLGVEASPYEESARNAASYFKRVTDKVGEPIAVSRVRTDVIAEDFTREIWLEKFEAAAIAWTFTFYQPHRNGWKLVGISYSTELDDLYQPLTAPD